MLIGTTVAAHGIGSSYQDNFSLPQTQSFQAMSLLEHAAPKVSGDVDRLVVATNHGKVTAPAVRRRMDQLLARIARLPHVTEIGSPYATANARQIAPSGQVAFADDHLRPARIGAPGPRGRCLRHDDPVRVRPRRHVCRRRAGSRGRQPIRTVHRPADRLRRRRSRPVARVRHALSDDAAADHRRLRAGHEHRRRRARLASLHDRLLLRTAFDADRPRRRRRLRAFHRHPLPPGNAARVGARGGGRGGARHLRSRGDVRRRDRLRGDARDDAAGRLLPVRRGGVRRDHRCAHGDIGDDADARPAGACSADACCGAATAARSRRRTSPQATSRPPGVAGPTGWPSAPPCSPLRRQR